MTNKKICTFTLLKAGAEAGETYRGHQVVRARPQPRHPRGTAPELIPGEAAGHGGGAVTGNHVSGV